MGKSFLRALTKPEKLKAFSVHKALLCRVLQHGIKRLIVACGVEYGDGLCVSAKLLEGENFKKLLKGTNAAGEHNKGIGLFLHELLSFAHGIGINKLAAIFVQYTRLVKKARGYADDAANVADALQQNGIDWDFVYEYDGEQGIWIEIQEDER